MRSLFGTGSVDRTALFAGAAPKPKETPELKKAVATRAAATGAASAMEKALEVGANHHP
jgi:hypothetical protein